MPFVSRDDTGQIMALFDRPNAEATEKLASAHPDVAAFLKRTGDAANLQETLAGSDPDMGRVLEDLIECLIEKRVILLTDLPPAALEKISHRRHLRGKLSGFEAYISLDTAKVI